MFDPFSLKIESRFLLLTSPYCDFILSLFSDKDLEVLDMCGHHKMDFTDEIHLVFNGTRRNLKECQCWVNKGAFTLIIKELRLIEKNGGECSESTLMISTKHYTCDAQVDKHHGEMIKFEGSSADASADAFISLVFGDSGTPPERVNITLKPDGKSSNKVLIDMGPRIKYTLNILQCIPFL